MEMEMIDISKIQANPLQPRQDFDEEKLQELANSIKEAELLQPIVLRKNAKGYDIVAGERRYKAFQILKESEIPAIIRDVKDDTDALEKSIIENWQRDNLTSIERENALQELWGSGRYKTHGDLAKKLGKSKTRIEHLLGVKTYRDEETVGPAVSSDVILSSGGLKPKARKKLLKTAEKKGMGERTIREIASRVKEFSEENQQLEILEEFEKQEKFSKKGLDIIVEKKKEIAEGKRQPEIHIKSDSKERFVDGMEKDFENTFAYGVANIETLPKIHRDRAVKLAIDLVGYWLKQLKELGDDGVVEAILKRAGVD